MTFRCSFAFFCPIGRREPTPSWSLKSLLLPLLLLPLSLALSSLAPPSFSLPEAVTLAYLLSNSHCHVGEIISHFILVQLIRSSLMYFSSFQLERGTLLICRNVLLNLLVLLLTSGQQDCREEMLHSSLV